MDNILEYYAGDTEKCHYCNKIAKYNDLAEIDQTYDVVGVCECHAFKGLSS